MQLARSILQQNTDPTFLEEIVADSSITRKSELVQLLQQGKQVGFNEGLLDYIFDEYEEIIKAALKNSYHPTMIDVLRKYTAKQGLTQRNIESRMFHEPDELRNFFTIHKVNLETTEVEAIIHDGFVDNTIVVGSSYVINDKDDLYFHFSAVKKIGKAKSGSTKFEYVRKNFSGANWEGLDSVSQYLKKIFPEETLFSLLNLDPKKIL